MRTDAKYANDARQRLYAAAAVVSLALWLFMVVAEIYTPLHAWLHGGTIPDNDDCAIVALTHGKVETAACDLPVLAAMTWIEVAPGGEFSVFGKTIESLLSGRAPPELIAVS